MNLQEKIDISKMEINAALLKYNKVRLACSFGKDSMVVLHLAKRIKSNIDVFFVNTPFKPEETRNYALGMHIKWNLNLEVVEADPETTVFSDRELSRLWKTNPDLCCYIFKVEPTKKALEGVDCWITGLRNTEGKTRKDYKEIEIDKNIVKLNPILTWTEREVWQYLATHNIPVHPWYKKGYRSLGCAPCTAIVDEKDSERDGRWKGTCKEAGECGIHTMSKGEKD